MKKRIALTLSFLVLAATAAVRVRASGQASDMRLFPNPTGAVATFTNTGVINTGSAFFQNLGTNGRTCATCHQESDGWGVSARHVQLRFAATLGADPIFRPVDGAVCPTTDVSTVEARYHAYSMLLSKGLIRVSMPVPDKAQFSLINVDDPYHCATANALALFRRPLPATNLKFLSAVMWDGRETISGAPLSADLASQALDATMGHAQGARPTDAQLQDIVDFETGLYTAQMVDFQAGGLTAAGANGGPRLLSEQPFYLGINDALGGDPTGAAFNPNVFDLYDAWQTADGRSPASEFRRAVARGEQIFNTFPIPITGVGGLNDALNRPVVMGTCSTCHDSPNSGSHSLSVPLNIGVADEAHRTPDLPLYTFQCTNGAIVKVSDPGRGLITGKCEDLGKFKGPVLRGLAARAPYFHNGSAATLMDAVNFYDTRFNLHLTAQQKSDLVAFLQTL